MRIDELNILKDNSPDSFDYIEFIDHYFDVMQITKAQKKKRIEEAKAIFDAILFFLIWCENAPERVQEEETQRLFENLYREVIFQVGEPDEYFDTYVALFIPTLISTTLSHIGEKYFTSVERAAYVSVNESNTVYGHIELENAKALGCTKKTWLAEIDDRTRPDHIEMNEWTVPIDDYFVFEDCMMFFAHDEVNGTARQTVNCRCATVYS